MSIAVSHVHSPSHQSPLLEWFEYLPDEDLVTYALSSELTDRQRHLITLDCGEWRIDPIQIPDGSMTVPEALTYQDELNRLVAAASFLNAKLVYEHDLPVRIALQMGVYGHRAKTNPRNTEGREIRRPAGVDDRLREITE